MRIAITLGDQSQYEGRGNKHCYSSLSRREPEPLPQFIKLQTPGVLDHELLGSFVCDYLRVPGSDADDFSGGCSFCRGLTKTER
jgi:hypothetical protein